MSMDERTLEALRGSVRKWEMIVEGTGGDSGRDNCPLCRLFNGTTPETDLGCDGCPVSERTGCTGCSDTPYDAWMREVKKDAVFFYPYVASTDVRRELARRELEFLRSLLPTEEGAT